MTSKIEARTAVVTIYGGDVLDRIRHLERQAEAARDAAEDTPRTLDELPEYLTLAAEHDALVKEAEANALHVKVQALGRRRWRQLCEEHPPRKAGPNVTDRQAREDAAAGVNEDTFRDALVPLSIVEPDLTEDDLDALADVDYERLYLTAFALNRAPATDPKASLVSRLTQTSDATSS